MLSSIHRTTLEIMENNNDKSTIKKYKNAYTGTFDPWTKGHQSVVESFLKKDPDSNIEIIIGKNSEKENQLLTEDDRAFVIKKGISKKFLSRIRVTIFDGVIADYMYEQDIPYFIKGVRDEKDYREEVSLANLNSQLFGSPMTLLIPQVEANLNDVSSSNLKLLGNLGIPMNKYANAFTRELMKMKTTEKLFIGVTGGIASGKSTFCKNITEYAHNNNNNIPIQSINMDRLGHIVLESKDLIPLFSKARNQIAKQFGQEILEQDGTINRHKLGEKAFGDNNSLDILTNLLSEPIFYLLAKEIRSIKKGIILIESTILIDRHITELVDDNIIHVFANKEIQAKRMHESRNLTEDQAIKRINSQLSSNEISEKIEILQRDNFDRLYLPVETNEPMSKDDIDKIYQILICEYSRRKEVRRTDELFILEEISVKDESLFFNELSSHYSHPKRGYHNLRHIAEMLTLFQIHKANFQYPKEVYLAILLHDVIYDVAQKDNEQKSATFAEKFIKSHIQNSEININKVKHLIELTAMHDKELINIDDDAKLFLDMDMAILSSSKQRILEYETEIYKEYSVLYSKKEYLNGRIGFLQSVLEKKKQIYLSELFKDKLEGIAKNNILFLLENLRADIKQLK